MKMALVTLDYPPERGGVARYLGNLVEVSQGQMDVFVHTTHPISGPGHVQSLPLLASGPVSWRAMIPQLRHLKDRGYEMVFVSHALPVGTAAWLAKRLGGLPYVVLLHGLDLRLAARSWRKKWLLKQILSSARLVLTNSVFVAQEVKTLLPNGRTEVLLPGVESLSFPSRQAARQQCGISADTCQLLTVSRLVPRKGIDMLLMALAHLPSTCRLTIIGTGEDAERLQRLARENGVQDRVQFLYRVSDDERNAWYSASDIFVLPVRDEGNDVEGFGIVYLEASLAGLPIVAGKSGGAGEAVEDHHTGLLVDPTDPIRIADAIQQLSQDPALRERMGQAGRTRALRDFRWSDRWKSLQSWLN